jgi:Uma2 family endonuclease
VTASAHPVHYTFREYVAHEAASNVKHEYLDGQIYAMAGGTPSHAALASAITGILYPQLRGGPCRAHSSDLRVRVAATGLATYPDVTIVCGPRELDPDDKNTVTNPTLIVEILSPSTEEYDRGEKLEHYRRIPTLRQVVLVAHRERRVDVWTRGEGGVWTSVEGREHAVVELDAIGARLDVGELYEAAAAP